MRLRAVPLSWASVPSRRRLLPRRVPATAGPSLYSNARWQAALTLNWSMNPGCECPAGGPSWLAGTALGPTPPPRPPPPAQVAGFLRRVLKLVAIRQADLLSRLDTHPAFPQLLLAEVGFPCRGRSHPNRQGASLSRGGASRGGALVPACVPRALSVLHATRAVRAASRVCSATTHSAQCKHSQAARSAGSHASPRSASTL